MRDALPDADDRARLIDASATAVIVGVGNELRRDDGAGLKVVRLIQARRVPPGLVVRAHSGDPLGLLEAWRGCGAAVIVDAMRCDGVEPGTIRRLDASRVELPELRAGHVSTHAAGVGQAIELARVLGRLPDRVIVLAVQGARFDPGPGISPPVRAVLPLLAAAALAEALISGSSTCPPEGFPARSPRRPDTESTRGVHPIERDSARGHAGP